MKYIVYFTFKDDNKKLNEIPLDTWETEMEAKSYRDGYMAAIINHTGNAKQSEVMGLFNIRRVDEIIEEDVVNNKDKEKEQ